MNKRYYVFRVGSTGWNMNETEDAETHEEAVRQCLTKEQIIEDNYISIESNTAIYSDEFNHDGVFDDIAEELE